MNKLNRKRGFSLVEIMVVVVIIGLLAGIVGANVVSYLRQARITAAKTQMTTFGSILKLYQSTKGSYPSNSEGLEILTKPDKNGDTQIDAIPVDPWGTPYEYKRKGNNFEIISFGADKRDGGEGENADIKYSEMNKKED